MHSTIYFANFVDLLPPKLCHGLSLVLAGNICFFGKCDYYCDSAFAFCGHPDMIEVSLMSYLPSRNVALRKSWYQPWRRSYRSVFALNLSSFFILAFCRMNYCQKQISSAKTRNVVSCKSKSWFARNCTLTMYALKSSRIPFMFNIYKHTPTHKIGMKMKAVKGTFTLKVIPSQVQLRQKQFLCYSRHSLFSTSKYDIFVNVLNFHSKFSWTLGFRRLLI